MIIDVEEDGRASMKKDLGLRTRREIFDVMIAPQLLGIEQVGMTPLIEMVAAVEAKVENLLGLR